MISNYLVSGMTCGHCVNHVIQEVKAIPGVTDVQLVLDGTLVITSGAPIAFGDVASAVAEAGDYTVASA